MIKRKILSELKSHLSSKEITLLVGARQAGKTTLLRILEEELKVSGHKPVFLNLDIEADNVHFKSQDGLLKKIRLEIGNSGFVFIDEIQRKENAGIFLKGIYDQNLSYKFIVSGSGSLELKEKIHESLAGRKRLTELSTISFEEFVNFRTGYQYEDRLDDYFRIETEKTALLLEEYLDFGGYPQVMLSDRVEEKTKLINEIYQSYLEKDIRFLLDIKKTDAMTNLFRLVAAQSGSLINVSELSSTLGIAAATVKNYLWYFEKTFIIKKVSPYFANIRKEITKSPLYYFSDLGMKNFATGDFGHVSRTRIGHLFKNFIFNMLQEKLQDSSSHINFWRTKDGAEVDFIIKSGSKIIPVEVKYRQIKKPETTRSLQSFISAYQPDTALVVNLNYKDEIWIGKTKVCFVSFYELISYDFKFLL
ncbi:MAG: ATPase [Deltaproteobacteria bacterium CG12_big_fil_rev_8_21_14_0_65_43_10]|nr:MAG: ATPase [Deltaproteobacteria bacterium CG12_big_fil_rev_8_21_14_0_65_43_10]PIU85214.1 MAG: ATPase [Deltaproteobacteria bacterium CG06_land_8_20_14_3_00_44_19]PIX24436.1 MAG: ATPase [Deltaproteobacteria bacterium CG_4_8_14_3_um_filter_43_13]PIZ20218.1 MAG: ATPase [Deltaproteobacteria bacterium CG_4_10_14_0_8_um_filter_43_12]PJB46037.1 MAG: ATPase [Deltaproteobacteria bacterium CG_4_9_14_3_um_filter_44_9]